MIYLELSGGLGNQLFEYAMARRLLEKVREQKKDEKLTLILVRYDKDIRNYSLSPFMIEKNIRIIPKWKQKLVAVYYKAKKHLVQIFKTNDSKFIIGAHNFKIMQKYGMFCTTDVYEYYEYEIPKRNSIYIYGNYQSEKYFSDVESIIRNDLRVNEALTMVDSAMLEKVRRENSVAVHIRRGDYLAEKWAKSLNICDENYYVKAMYYIIENVMDPVFYVFSNDKKDLDWIRKNMKLPGNIHYVDQDGMEIDDFYLMSNCKHHIISNSTYSWWSSYLANREGKIVVAPNRWYKTDDQQAEDIYIDTWKLIAIDD